VTEELSQKEIVRALLAPIAKGRPFLIEKELPGKGMYSHEDWKTSRAFASCANGYPLWCLKCGELHVVTVHEDGKRVIIGRCGAFSFS